MGELKSSSLARTSPNLWRDASQRTGSSVTMCLRWHPLRAAAAGWTPPAGARGCPTKSMLTQVARAKLDSQSSWVPP